MFHEKKRDDKMIVFATAAAEVSSNSWEGLGPTFGLLSHECKFVGRTSGHFNLDKVFMTEFNTRAMQCIE